MTLSVHQPNFAPWLGYFHKMKQSDVFVFMDTVQFVKRHICNRQKIKNSQEEAQWITVAVSSKKGQDVSFLELEVNYEQKWQDKMVNTLRHAYGKAPYFQTYFPRVEELIRTEFPNLAELNIALITFLARHFDVHPRLERMSDIPGDLGTKSEQIIKVCQHYGADVYLSGQGAKSYNDAEAYQAAGIELRYTDFKHPTYPQVGAHFISHLSGLDLLFNCGPESPQYI
jgi:hypothetical protein